MDRLIVRGARQHNLRNVSCELPRNRLIVVTGPSGSGKSSLAFDTIYAEGQRRYVESLSAYARQFLEQLAKPDVDNIEGLSPAIAIEQRALAKSPRSTVGTVTETADYLRLLFARVGVPHCPKCGKRIEAQTVQQIVDHILEMGEGARLTILAPIVRARKGELKLEFDRLRRERGVRRTRFANQERAGPRRPRSAPLASRGSGVRLGPPRFARPRRRSCQGGPSPRDQSREALERAPRAGPAGHPLRPARPLAR